MKSAKDLTGQRFGRLVAVRPTLKRKHGKVVWECRCDCGVVTTAIAYDLKSGHTRSCGCLKKEIVTSAGTGNANWKGGRKITPEGYVLIYLPDHPDAQIKGYILEHRLVMEKKLGRRLRPEEVVHHIDGDPANNAEANLDLFPDTGKHKAYHHKLERIAEET